MDSFQDLIIKNREFFKDSVRKTVDFSKTEQNNGISPPPVQKPYPKNADLN